MQIYIRKEKYNIYLASVKKSEIFADAIKNKNIEFFNTVVADYVELIEDETFEFLCNKFKINFFRDKNFTYNYVLQEVFKRINKIGEVENNYLTFLYVIATGEKPENSQKIGTALTIFLANRL